jgi:hypothetical protein
MTQFTHGGRDDQSGGEADGDAAGRGSGPGTCHGLVRRAQQRLGEREKDRSGLGELNSLRGAVEQACAQLLFQTGDLATERRLSEVHGFGRASEVPVLGHGRETPQQPQIEVRGWLW